MKAQPNRNSYFVQSLKETFSGDPSAKSLAVQEALKIEDPLVKAQVLYNLSSFGISRAPIFQLLFDYPDQYFPTEDTPIPQLSELRIPTQENQWATQFFGTGRISANLVTVEECLEVLQLPNLTPTKKLWFLQRVPTNHGQNSLTKLGEFWRQVLATVSSDENEIRILAEKKLLSQPTYDGPRTIAMVNADKIRQLTLPEAIVTAEDAAKAQSNIREVHRLLGSTIPKSSFKQRQTDELSADQKAAVEAAMDILGSTLAYSTLAGEDLKKQALDVATSPLFRGYMEGLLLKFVGQADYQIQTLKALVHVKSPSTKTIEILKAGLRDGNEDVRTAILSQPNLSGPMPPELFQAFASSILSNVDVSLADDTLGAQFFTQNKVQFLLYAEKALKEKRSLFETHRTYRYVLPITNNQALKDQFLADLKKGCSPGFKYLPKGLAGPQGRDFMYLERGQRGFSTGADSVKFSPEDPTKREHDDSLYTEVFNVAIQCPVADWDLKGLERLLTQTSGQQQKVIRTRDYSKLDPNKRIQLKKIFDSCCGQRVETSR